MIGFQLGRPAGSGLTLLCLGAHSDDIEIGCGGTIRELLQARADVSVHWVVFSGSAARAREARRSAALFLRGARSHEVQVHDFQDGFFPYIGARIKEVFEELKRSTSPDLILTHHDVDAHQDHRQLSQLTWNTFRDHLVLEYEIPKYDGGLTTPNVYSPVSDANRRDKAAFLMESFVSQRGQRWFTPETFDALSRLRGIECASPTGYAEGFHLRKAICSW
jgi:LmbE family N-acetylglucosaminyl deacetylase